MKCVSMHNNVVPHVSKLIHEFFVNGMTAIKSWFESDQKSIIICEDEITWR